MGQIITTRWFLCILAVGAAGAVAQVQPQVVRLDSKGQPGQEGQILVLSDAPASSGDAQEGVAVPKQRVTLSAPLSSVILRLAVKEGDLVDRGQLVAEMDHGVARAAVVLANHRAKDEAAVRRTEHALRHAQLQLKSIAKAHEAGAGSDYELRQAQLRHDEAEASYNLELNRRVIAKAALKLEKQKYARYLVHAPFAGRVVRVFTQPGTMLRASQPVVSIVALQTLEATVHVPLTMFGTLEAGQSYTLLADEPVGRPLQATLQTIDPMIEAARGTFRCVFTIANDDESLPAGFAVRLDTGGLEQASAISKDVH